MLDFLDLSIPQKQIINWEISQCKFTLEHKWINAWEKCENCLNLHINSDKRIRPVEELKSYFVKAAVEINKI